MTKIMTFPDSGSFVPEEVDKDEGRKNLPSLDFIKKQMTRIGGEVLILGLTTRQATAVESLAKENGITVSESTLSSEEIDSLSKGDRFSNVTAESKTLYLGSTVDCQDGLLKLLENI